MASHPNLLFLDKIYDGPRTIVLRSRIRDNSIPIIIKTINSQSEDQDTAQRLEFEYDILKDLDGKTVIRALGWEWLDGEPAIVLEDIGGASLDHVLQEGPLGLHDALCVALDVVQALQAVHDRRIVHKDVNPSNIVWNRATGAVRLIDFGIACRLSADGAAGACTDVVEGNLAYIAPEQTGRVAQSVDHRSDFYALGATLYEMVTGRQPFPSSDAMALVHAHIARLPEPPAAIAPTVPEAVSAVIMKLMAKRPEDRYQSAYGLTQDLKLCLERLEIGDTQLPFVPGGADLSSRFTVSAALYGRAREVEALLAAARRAARGGFEIAMVGGYSGIGKTTVVRQIQTPTVTAGGHFVVGKFDSLTRSIPYFAFGQALKALVAQILGAGEDGIRVWCRRLLDALGVNGAIAVSIVPEVGHIIGPQMPAPALPPQETLNRANLVLRQLIKAFTSRDQALVLFLDDLQWADAASLQLLRLLARDTAIDHLLIVGAFRDNEVDAAHPLALTLAEIRQVAAARLTEITLPPLDRRSIEELIADSLHARRDDVADLAAACAAKTDGNPFFLSQFLRTLHGRGYIAFDAADGRWRWDSSRVAGAAVADNVIDLMVDRIHGFPLHAQTALQLAACIGTRFDLDTLAALCARSLEETADNLADALGGGLILPVDDAEPDPPSPSADRSAVCYRFVHDRVREAASSLIDPAGRTAIHLEIGRLLLDRLTQDQIEARVFEVVNHLNIGADRIDDAGDRLHLAALNLRAGRKAKASAAAATALDYVAQGLTLLPEGAWDDHYALALALHQEAVETAYLAQRYDRMQAHADRVLAFARTTLDTAKVVEGQVYAATACNRLREAVDIGLAFLARLGCRFPPAPTGQDVVQTLHHVQALLADRTVESLAELPAMTDPAVRTIVRMINTLAVPTYNVSPELFLCMSFRQIELIVHNGSGPDAAVPYSTYALALCAIAEQYADGDAFGRLAFAEAERFQADHLKARIHLNVFNFVHHWRHHLVEALEPLSEGYRIAQAHGDPLFAALNAHVYCHHRLYTATDLAEADRALAENYDIIAKLDQQHMLIWTGIYWQTAQNLIGQAENPLELVGRAFDEREQSDIFREGNDQTLFFVFHFCKLILAFFFDDEDQCRTQTELAEKYLHTVVGITHVPICRFYATLSRLARLDRAEGEEREALMTTVLAHRAQMQRWGESAPMNYGHRSALLEAEILRVQGRSEAAAVKYDEAIAQATDNRYAGDAALANELAGRFHLSKGLAKVARLYLGDAVRGYRRWGALAKVRHMERRYGALLASPRGRLPGMAIAEPSSVRDVSQDSLDLASALKTSQAIAAEIVPDRLLDRMMRAVMENAGAERGFLIGAEDGGRLTIRVEARVGQPTRIRAEAPPLDAGHALSTAVVNYVAATGRSFILNQAEGDGLFADDRYIVDNDPLSVLCLPLNNRGQPIAVLYLENNLTADAFTQRHLAMLELLSGQMAISIENAKLYEELEQRVADRTHSLEEKVVELSRAYETVRRAQRQLEAQAVELRTAKEVAEAANLSKSAFLASVSHELRTPLNAILGFSEILRDEACGPTEAGMLRDYAGTIHESGQHLLAVINDLLDLAKIEAGRLELELEPLDVGREVAACMRMVAQRAMNHGLTLTRSVSSSLPLLVADRRTLRQMLFNLLSNAIKFTPSGGSVDIGASVDADRCLRIAVADTGIGIDAEEQATLFTPFVRTPEAQRRRIEGTGLGLALVKSMIEEHGGRVELTSAPGAGATFTLVFPPTDTIAAAKPDQAAQSA